jgi:uncharacterized protein YbjT (DUF2867 family)
MSPTHVLVIGATGTQGGAVVEHLRSGEHGQFEVHGMTRDPDSGRARELAARGVPVVRGDLMDRQTLIPLLQDVDAVFGMTDYWAAGGKESEFQQGNNLVEAAVEADLDHFVFSSIENCDAQPGVPLVDVKYDIEQVLRERDVPTTILRAHNFMQNFEKQRERILSERAVALALDEGVSLRYVDVDDIDAVAAEALARPDDYTGRTLELAGDEHTLESMAAVFSDVVGSDIRPDHVPPDAVRAEMGEEYAVMFEWFNNRDYETELATIQAAVDVEFTSLEEYLRDADWDR